MSLQGIVRHRWFWVLVTFDALGLLCLLLVGGR